MKRAALVASGMLVLGGALALPGIAALRGPAGRELPAADTAALNGAIAFFEQRLRNDPLDMTAARRLSQRYVLRFGLTARQEDLARAEQVTRLVVHGSVDPAEDLAALSAVLLMRHGFEQAYDAALGALAADPSRDAARGALFDAALAMGRYAEADSVLEEADRDALAWRVRRAHLLEVRGRTERASNLLDGVCRRLSRGSARKQVQAWCLTEQARMEGARAGDRAAERLLRRALSVQPGYRGAIEGLADLAHARAEWEASLELYRLIATDAHPDLYLRMAEAHAGLGRQDAAREHEHAFLRVARAEGNEAPFALELAGFYARRAATRDTALAIALRDLGRRQAVETYEALARIYERRDEPAAARAAWHAARRARM